MLQTPEEDNAYLDLRQENDELLRRLADVQQQMWTLEEKVIIHFTSASWRALFSEDRQEK